MDKKKNIGDRLKTRIYETTKTVKSVAEDVHEKVGDIASNVKGNPIPRIRTPEKVKAIFSKENIKDVGETNDTGVISTQSAIRLIYYLMTVDGLIVDEEESNFSSMCKELDPTYEEHMEEILAPCIAQTTGVEEEDALLEAVRDGIEDTIISSEGKEDSFITHKVLIWNLLTIAYSDKGYDECEKIIVEYIADRYQIEENDMLEMESSLMTLVDLERELEWIKTTDRPYKEIESHVNEIEQRKSVIFDSVKDIITL